MKCKILFLLLATLISRHTIAQPGCQSLFSNIVRAADNIIIKVSNLEQSAAEALGPYIISATTGVPARFTTTPEARRAISDFASSAIAVQNQILGLIGEVSGTGGSHIGPRYLYIPTARVTGELFTERTFIISPSSYHKVTVKIKKLDGRAGANITVCAKWPDGTEYNVKDRQYFVDGEQSVGKEQEWVFLNMKDKWLTVHLVHTGIVTNKFDYQLSIEGEYNAGTLDEINKKRNRNRNRNNNNNNNRNSNNEEQPVVSENNRTNPAIMPKPGSKIQAVPVKKND